MGVGASSASAAPRTHSLGPGPELGRRAAAIYNVDGSAGKRFGPGFESAELSARASVSYSHSHRIASSTQSCNRSAPWRPGIHSGKRYSLVDLAFSCAVFLSIDFPYLRVFSSLDLAFPSGLHS